MMKSIPTYARVSLSKGKILPMQPVKLIESLCSNVTAIHRSASDSLNYLKRCGKTPLLNAENNKHKLHEQSTYATTSLLRRFGLLSIKLAQYVAQHVC